MKYIKKIISSFKASLIDPLFNIYDLIYENVGKIYKMMVILLSPIVVFYFMTYILLFISGFLFWEMPIHYPLPFIGEIWVDRALLLIGGLILIFGDLIEWEK